MNIQRTIQFIVESQAKAEVRMDRADARAIRMEQKFDRKLDAILKLIRQGMKSIAELAEAQRSLAEAQRATERTLKALVQSSRNGRNGDAPRNGR